MPRLLAFAIKEAKEALPPIVFFAIGFNLIELTTQLILDDYLVRFANFMVATGAALVVGKAVLVANAIPLLRRFDSAPLIEPILFKTAVYVAIVFVVRVLEKLIEYFLGGGTLDGMSAYVAEHFTWHRFAAVQIWISVLFLVYTSIIELSERLGEGVLFRFFFGAPREGSQP
jgi:hypothetical protein